MHIAVDVSAPSKPANLQEAGNVVGSVKLAWTPSTDSVSGMFHYEVATTAGALLQTPSSSSLWISGLTPGATYTFHVRAIDKAGNASAWSTSVTVTVAAPPATSIITTPSAPDGSNGWFKTSPTISLLSSQPGVTYYAWDGQVGFLTYGSLLLSTEGSHTLTYYSVNTAGVNEAKQTRPINVDCGAPPKPPVYSAVISGSDITVSWGSVTDSVSGLAGYQILDYINGSLSATIGVPVSPGATQTCGIHVPTDPTLHTFRVIAFDVAGNRSSTSNVLIPSVAPGGAASHAVAKASSSRRAVAAPQFDAQTPGLISTQLDTPPAPPIGYLAVPGTSYEVTASAPLTGSAVVVLTFDPATLHGPASNVRMMHYHGGQWVDITTEVDVAGNRVSGTTNSFSPFELFEVNTVTTSTPASSWQSLLVLALLGLVIGSVSLHRLEGSKQA